MLFVQAGLIRTKVHISDLELIKEDKKESQNKGSTKKGHIGLNKALSVRQEVNIIGMTVDEAIPTMEKFLDDAYLAHLKQVTVIHGRGTGALRNAVHEKLKQIKYVKGFRLGEYSEGNMGVTVVEFK